MKYFLYEETLWQLFYWKYDSPKNIDIINKFIKLNWTHYTHAEKFNKDKYEAYDGHSITNDEDVYIFYTTDNKAELWQIGSKVTDCQFVIIPNLYHIRKIGELISNI